MLTKLDLDCHYADDIYVKHFGEEYWECEGVDEFSESHAVLPNVPRVREILGNTKILAEGKNWLIIECRAISGEQWEKLEDENLVPYSGHYYTINNFRK